MVRALAANMTHGKGGGGGPAAAREVRPPDGGWGWVIVACCFLVTVCTRAVTRCISIFFVEFQGHFEGDYSATAWIHSLVDCTTMLCAPLGSVIANRWSCRVSVILGGVLSSSGLLIASFAPNLEFLYLTLGVLTGLGFALCYSPAISMVGCYFSQRKALAYGIAMSGSGIGTFVLAPVVQLLIDYYTWRGALLILSGLVANLCVCGALLRPIAVKPEEEEVEAAADEGQLGSASEDSSPPTTPSSPQPLLPGGGGGGLPMARRRRFSLTSCLMSSREYGFLLLPDFLGLALSFLFLASGCSLPFVYLVPYALSVGLTHTQAAFLMSMLGVSSIVGNVTFGWLTDRRCLKPYRLSWYSFSVAMEGVCCLFTPLLSSFGLLVPFSALYGYFDGAYVALIPVVTSDLVGTAYLSSALGVVYFLHAVPYLLSPPIGGWLVDVTGSYTSTFFLSGFALLTSSVVIAAVAGVRHCRLRGVTAQGPVAVDTKDLKALTGGGGPGGLPDQRECYITVNKDAVAAVGPVLNSLR